MLLKDNITELGSPAAPGAGATAGPDGSAEGAGAAPSARSPLGRELDGRELDGLAHSADKAG